MHTDRSCKLQPVNPTPRSPNGLFISLALAFLGLTAPSAIPAEENPVLKKLENYNLSWESPSENAHGSMPPGNGEIGINAWAEPSGDLLFFRLATPMQGIRTSV